MSTGESKDSRSGKIVHALRSKIPKIRAQHRHQHHHDEEEGTQLLSSQEAKPSYTVPETETATEISTEENIQTKFKVGSSWLEFLLSDSVLLLLAALAIAVYPTYKNYSTIVKTGQVPLLAVLTWLIVAVAATHAFFVLIATLTSSHTREAHVVVTAETSAEAPPPDKKKTHRMLHLLFGEDRLHFRSHRRPLGSNLNPSRLKIFSWQKDQHVSKRKLARLLHSTKFRRRKGKEDSSSTTTTTTSADVQQTTAQMQNQNALVGAESSLHGFVVEPLASLRGIDIFLTENADDCIAKHPFLIEEGVRDVPTMIINFVTVWGNTILYFKLPEWVQDFKGQEHESDTDSVKALKRFLGGDDDYRNARFYMVPDVMEAPLPVKVLAPPPMELLVSMFVPVRWTQHAATTTSLGRNLALALEAEVDCISAGRAVRSATNLAKSSLRHVQMDVAVVIDTPVNQTEKEPQACVGMCRFNHVNVALCPYLPDRENHSAAPKQ